MENQNQKELTQADIYRHMIKSYQSEDHIQITKEEDAPIVVDGENFLVKLIFLNDDDDTDDDEYDDDESDEDERDDGFVDGVGAHLYSWALQLVDPSSAKPCHHCQLQGLPENHTDYMCPGCRGYFCLKNCFEAHFHK